MRQLFEAGPQAFFDAALPILRTDCENHGVQYLVTLLLINDFILKALSDPEVFSLQEATHLAQILLRIEPLLDIKLARGLIDVNNPNSKQELEEKAGCARGTRVLEILSAISDGARILAVMAQLLHHSNPAVRSKAALMVGRSNKNPKWVTQQFEESDPRVRANAVESLWGVDSEESRAVFWSALADPHSRVVGNALLALYRLGEVASIPLIIDLLKHESTEFRISGIWVMGETGDQRFVGLLARYFSAPIPGIRSAAFRSVAKLKKEGAKYSTRPPIEIDLSNSTQSASQIRVSVAAWTEAPDRGHILPVSGQKATAFVIYENSELITNYEVQEFSHPESNAIAFALPRVSDTDDPFQQACVKGFELGLRHKKKSENWLVLKYIPEKEREIAANSASVRTTGASILRLDQPADVSSREFFSLPSDARFNADPEAILDAVTSMGTRMSLPPNLSLAAKALLPVTAQYRGSRHLVLMPHPLIGNAGSTWHDMARQARLGKVAIHTITLEDCPGLQILCESTGGSYQRVPDVSGISTAIQSLCAKLVNHYEIRFRAKQPPASAPTSLKVQIYCQQGFGEQTCTPSFQPQLEQALAG